MQKENIKPTMVLLLLLFFFDQSHSRTNFNKKNNDRFTKGDSFLKEPSNEALENTTEIEQNSTIRDNKIKIRPMGD